LIEKGFRQRRPFLLIVGSENYSKLLKLPAQKKIYLCTKTLLMKRIIVLVFIFSLLRVSFAQNQEVPFTLADRDRIIQTEEKLGSLSKEIGSLRNEMSSLRNEMSSLRNEMSSLRNEMDARFEAVNAKIDYMYWVQGVIIALIIFMLGFIIWDRRTVLDPVKADVIVLKKENEKMKNIFIFLSETQPQLREMLKNAGIL
jgi:hypothetical protein